MVAIFAVEAVSQFPKDDFPTELVYGGTDDAALRLITCDGTFDRAERSYRDNVVVLATLVGSHPASQSPEQAHIEDPEPISRELPATAFLGE